MLNFKLLKINNEYVLISDEKIYSGKDNGWVLDENNNIINLAFYHEKCKGKVIAVSYQKYDIPLIDKNEINLLLINKSYSIIELEEIHNFAINNFANFLIEKLGLNYQTNQISKSTLLDYIPDKENLNNFITSLNYKKEWSIDIELDIQYSNKDVYDAEESDYLMNNHGSKGYLINIGDDPRVEIGNFIETSLTSSNGHETLSICGYKIIDSIKPKIENNKIKIKKIHL